MTYLIVNLNKKQYIDPERWGYSDNVGHLLALDSRCVDCVSGLVALLLDGNGRTSTDLKSKDPLVGSWAGDRIVITAPFADEGKWGVPKINANGLPQNLSDYCKEGDEYIEISEQLILAMAQDARIKRILLLKAEGGRLKFPPSFWATVRAAHYSE